MTTEPSRIKESLSEKDISSLRKEVGKISDHMCSIVGQISTAKTTRACNMSRDLEDLLNDLTPEKVNIEKMKNICASLVEISDIAVGVEVGTEEILDDAKKAKRHYYSAKKLVVTPIRR